MSTELLKTVDAYQLLAGTLQARGLYQIWDTKAEESSLWFNEEEAEWLQTLPDHEFIEEAKGLLSRSEICEA